MRTRKKPVMDFRFLDRCFLAVEPETWKRVNELLGQYGVAAETVQPQIIRTDTTVVEANIHYPTDCVASLGHLARGLAIVETGKSRSTRQAARTGSTAGRSSGCTFTSPVICPVSRRRGGAR